MDNSRTLAGWVSDGKSGLESRKGERKVISAGANAASEPLIRLVI